MNPDTKKIICEKMVQLIQAKGLEQDKVAIVKEMLEKCEPTPAKDE